MYSKNMEASAEIFPARIVRTIGAGRAYVPDAQVDGLMYGELADK